MHSGRATHICVGNLSIIGLDNGLSSSRRQTIVSTNAGILLIGTLETNFSEILIGIQILSFKIMHLKMSSVKWRPFCLGLSIFKPFIGPDAHCPADVITASDDLMLMATSESLSYSNIID